ncbi:hypothetical protein [Homoserinibacter sp. GY 40078]|uniref:hypothetical protein n=1 Tax=Homoserinibacter sp. GY 40078 TaxID=2603275 RepID=UPI0011CAF739|nr:hypothetical protein [Homoserinibacter sp. GY 40078]TXK19373.1 hypothetical protein FVQ89_05555 [Homoserinibacter sp. GY 40078]
MVNPRVFPSVVIRGFSWSAALLLTLGFVGFVSSALIGVGMQLSDVVAIAEFAGRWIMLSLGSILAAWVSGTVCVFVGARWIGGHRGCVNLFAGGSAVPLAAGSALLFVTPAGSGWAAGISAASTVAYVLALRALLLRRTEAVATAR